MVNSKDIASSLANLFIGENYLFEQIARNINIYDATDKCYARKKIYCMQHKVIHYVVYRI